MTFEEWLGCQLLVIGGTSLDVARVAFEAGRKDANRELTAALAALNRVRNRVVATQSASWSGTIYPLVAVLNAAGFECDERAGEIAAMKQGSAKRLAVREFLAELAAQGDSYSADILNAEGQAGRSALAKARAALEAQG